MSCSGFGYVKQYPVNPGCTLSGNCCENNTGYFSCPVNASECCDGLTVQNWIGLPGATGSSGPFGKVVLDQCGAVLNFWSNGSADIDVTAGSANVNIETANILCGAGAPTAPPAPNQGFAYFNDTNSSLSIWCPGGTGWNPIGGSTGSQGGLKEQLVLLVRREQPVLPGRVWSSRCCRYWRCDRYSKCWWRSNTCCYTFKSWISCSSTIDIYKCG